MAYEVTATRRRPQRFEDLIGQEFVVATLKNAIETQKIAHAYLFSGPRGCGKTSSARILAKALNCENGPTTQPCGLCSACQEITKGSSLDVIEIDGASNTSVNDIRQIKDELLFPPNALKYKIYIIDEVHMLSTSAFNALLKTIEEPPPYVIFIFATTELHKVPATIKSRCQQFGFRLVTPDQIRNLLADAAKENGIQADDEALYWIAKESTGSIRDAYTLYDQVAAFSGDHITFEKIKNKLGLASVDALNELCEFCVDGDSTKVLEKLDEILQKGISIDQFVVNITDYFRNLLLIQSKIKKESLLGQSPERFSQKVLTAWNSIKIERALSLFLQLYRDIRYSLSPRFELELAMSRLSWLSSYVSPTEVKKAVDATRQALLSESHNPNQGAQTTPPFSDSGYTENIPPVTAQVYKNQEIPQGDDPFLKMKMELQRRSEEKKAQIQNSQGSNFSNSNVLPVENFVEKQNFPQEKEQIYKSQDFINPTENFRQNTTEHSQYATEIIEPDPEDFEVDVPYLPQEDFEKPQMQKYKMQTEAQNFTEPQQNSRFCFKGEELKNEFLIRVSEEKSLLGAALKKVTNWQISDDSILLFVDSPFIKNQMESELNYFRTLLKELHGSNVDFRIEMATTNNKILLNNKTPPEVELLCKVFKGTEIKR